MTSDTKDDKAPDAAQKPRPKISRAGNAKEASDARSGSVRRIMERNKRSGES